MSFNIENVVVLTDAAKATLDNRIATKSYVIGSMTILSYHDFALAVQTYGVPYGFDGVSLYTPEPVLVLPPTAFFVVSTAQDRGISDASIVVAGTTYTTGSDFTISEFFPEGSYSVTFKAAGMQDFPYSFTVAKIPSGSPAPGIVTIDMSPAAAPPPAEPPPVQLPGEIPKNVLDFLVSGASTYLGVGAFTSLIDAVKSIFKSDAESNNKYSRILASVNPVHAAATFGDFIGEEAMQSAAFPISIFIREKEYALAQEQLDRLVDTWKSVKAYRDSFGSYNVTSGDVFEVNLQAMASAIISYQELLKKYRVVEPPQKSDFSCLVREIIDGDTIHGKIMSDDVTVRLVGINTPEKGEPYDGDSKRALFRFLWGRNVTVKIDPSKITDKYGRILGVVFFDGLNINLAMVRQGWAFYYPYEPHSQIPDSTFKEADALAKSEKRGIWGLINRAELAAPQGAIPIKSARTAIKVSSLPSHASIFLDGEYTYKLTSETIDVSPGRHIVEVRELGYDNQSAELDVPDGTVAEIHFKLDKL